MESIISTVYKEVNKLMPADSMNFGIYNSKLNRLDFPGTMEKGVKLDFHYASLDETHKLPVVCYNEEREIFINDMQTEANQYTGQDPVSLSEHGEIVDALIYIPTYSKGKLLGVISVQNFQKNSYKKYHLEVLKHISSYIGIAMENALLYEQKEDQSKRRIAEVIKQKNEIEKTHQNFTTINEIGKDIISSLSVEEILEKAYDNVNKLMDATAFVIGIYNNSMNRLEFPGAIEKGVKLPFNFMDVNKKSFATECFLNGKEVVINSVSEPTNIPENRKEHSPLDKPAGEMTESLIYLPLKKGEEIIGVISVQSFKKNAYSEYHIDILKTLANYTAIAIVNARSYESIATLSEIGKEISSSLDLGSVLKKLYKKVNELMDAPIFMVLSYSPKEDSLSYELCMEDNEQILEGLQHPLGDENTSFSAWTIRNNKEIIIGNHLFEHAKYIRKTVIYGGAQPNSLIFIPLVVEGNPVGILSVQSMKLSAYTKHHVELLRSLASYLSVSMNNAIAYKELDEARNEMKKLSIVASETSNSVVIMDKDGNFEWVNKAHKDLTGLDIDGLINKLGKNILDIKDEHLQKNLKLVFEKKVPVSFESKLHTAADDIIWVQSNISPVLNKQNEIVKIVAVDSDISEIKKTQDALRISQKDHKALFEQIIDSVFIFDNETLKFLDCNKAVINTYGYSKKEILSMTPLDLHPQWEHKKVSSKINENSKNENEYTHVTRDGKLILVEVRSEDVEYQGKKATMSFARDITKRKEFEDKILRQNLELQKLSIVASETDNAVVILDKDGTFEWVNQAYENMTGFNLEELKNKVGNSIKDLKDEKLQNHLEKVYRTKKSVAFESSYMAKTGNKLWVQTNISPVLDENNEISKLVALDSNITQRKEFELKIREKNKDITDSINYASRIQRAMLPKDDLIKQLIPDSFILYKPRDIVSGDFYWMTEGDDGSLYFAVVDCTGHGVPGAFLTIVGNNLLNQIIKFGKITDPGEVLSEMNKQMLLQFEGSTQGGMKDGMDMSLCKIIKNGNETKVEFAGAFNPLYLIRDNELTEFKANRFSIGTTLDNNPEYITNIIECQKGDTIYLCSDGYQDQIGGKKGKKFKKLNFMNLLVEGHSKPISEQREFYNDIIENWRGDFVQLDDILLMGISF